VTNTTTALKTITFTDATNIGVNSIVMLGGTVADHDGEHLLLSGGTKTGNSVSFTERVYHTYPVGTTVHLVSSGHQSAGTIDYETVCYYANWFPAIAADVGSPTGARDTAWITGASIGDGGSNIHRRNYSRAVVLFRPASTSTTAAQYNTLQPSGSTALGGTYYRLRASGKTDATAYTCVGTGAGCIGIRSGEGHVLLNYQIP
jgi:hypothetical protein